MWERGAEPGLLSEALNRHLGIGWGVSPVSLTEEELTFRCQRCGRRIRAGDAVVTRTAGEVTYECPHDAASFVTIHDQDYGFSEGDLTVRVDDQELEWWDFMEKYRAPPGPNSSTTTFTVPLPDEDEPST